jgi:serine/threonine protein kinase/Tol biopolymer transport system component
MTAERAREVERICQAALEREPSERAAFVTEACAGDNALRQEVDSLLAQEFGTPGFLSTPAAVLAGDLSGDGRSIIGRRLGAYEILVQIGEGGMGQVYRARDTKLGRDVAIKILPPAFTSDPERLARFAREARVLAALNHPHIGAIYGLEDAGSVRALVLELVEGPTLADRIERGRIPMAEALTIARQIADALEAAHEKGIVHRDLKPANVKLTPAGIVKVLDFGLAKIGAGGAGEAGRAGGKDLTNSPAISVSGTHDGVVLGTAAYMSPEQARGLAVDKRTDIWAFGCVLYEMLAGRAAFARATTTDTLAAVVDREPDWTVLPESTPPSITRLLRRCLDKDPKRRLRDIGEARVEIDDAQRAQALSADSSVPARNSSHGPISSRWVVGTFLGVVLVGIGTVAFLSWARSRAPAASAPNATRFFIGVTPADAFGPGPKRTNYYPYPTRTDVALSPDGTLLVFSGRKGERQQLYLRALNQLDATPIAGTDNSNSPFFSPDGRWLGFWTGAVEAGAIGELRKMRLDGSPAVTLAKVAPLRGATWGSNEIIFSTVEGEGRLWRVPAAGGMPETLTRLDSKDRRRHHSLPHILPDGRGVLFTIGNPVSNFADGQIAVLSPAGETHVVLDQGVDARYVSSGHLVYVRDSTLMSVPFDLTELRVTGPPVAIVKGLMQAVRTSFLSLNETGAAQFSISDTGALVYVSSVTVPEFVNSLVWVSRNGTVTPTTAPPGLHGGPRLSPDGHRIALFTFGRGILIYDLARGGLTPVVPGMLWPTWTPDGRITTTEPSGFVLTSIEAGVTDHIAIDWTPTAHPPGSWSPDGQTLLFTKLAANGVWEIRAFSRTEGERKVHPATNTQVMERYPQISPDGQWFVYSSNESGEEEVYVQRYQGAAERHPISTNGGTEPAWAPSGRELFYITATPEGHTRMMAVDVTLSPAFVAGIPHALFEGGYAAGTPHRYYDVSPDGRFLMLQRQETSTAPVTQMVLVLNWSEELKQRVPTR